MTQPLWIRAVVVREGPDVVTKCCIVANGDVHPFEVRVNLPALAATLRKLQSEGRLPGAGQDAVGGFGSFLNKAVKAVTQNKIVKAVTNVVRKVAGSPIVQIANPGLALGAHGILKGATGKGAFKGRLGELVDAGTAAVLPKALAYVSPKAVAALGVGAQAVNQSQLGQAVAAGAKHAQQAIAQGKNLAGLVNSGKVSAVAAAPYLKQALAIRGNIGKLAPVLAKKVQRSKKVRAAISNIASKAKAGNPEARHAAGVLVAAARMTDKISAAQQAAGGGNAGFVITKTGGIRKAPKGKFIRSASLPVIETLYRGAKAIPLSGSFTAVGRSGKRRAASEVHDRQTLVPAEYRALEAEVYRALVDDAYQRDTLPAPAPYRVSGSPGSVEHTPEWGGARDPGDEYDGPLYPVRYNDPEVSGRPRPAANWPKPAPHTTAAARDRAAALLELARARHHLEQARKRGTKVGNAMSHYMVGSHELPDEMSLNADGVVDSSLLVGHLGTGGTQGEIVGCGEIAGIPSYLLTRKGLSNPTVRRRVSASIKAMPPKLRRRVLDRLRQAVRAARPLVSGNLRGGYASIAGHGWTGIAGDSGGYEIVGSHRAHSLTP
jgi:hypothetical protein